MKKILTITLFVFSFALAYAQNLEDVVYLKGGKVVRGTVIEQNTEFVKIKVLNRYTFVYQIAEIEKIVKEPAQSGSYSPSYSTSASSQKIKEEKEVKPSGYYGMIELGFAKGFEDGDVDYFKFNFVNGYRFNQIFSAGIGVGLRYLPDWNYDEYYSFPLHDNLLPIFLDLRAKFGQGNVSPFVSLNVGNSFDPVNGFESVGLMINPSVGVRFKTGGKSAIHLSVGYEKQEMDVFVNDGVNFYVDKLNAGALSLNFGFTF